MPPECLERGATLVMAAPLAENRQRWIRELRATFATCEVNERRMLQQVIVNLQPNVLVVDLSLPALGGLSEIRRWSPATKIIALTDTPGNAEGMSTLKAGASGYCARTIGTKDLLKAVAVVQKGEIWATRELVRGLIVELVAIVDSGKEKSGEERLDSRLQSLTQRQRVVARLISRGASNKEVGNRLNISERTVKAHLTEAFRNVGVSDRLNLALLFQGHPHADGDD